MSVITTPEHEAFRKEIREFLVAEVAPKVAEYELAHRFPAETLAAMAPHGWLGLTTPVEYGGAGRDTLTYILAVEECSRVWGSLGITLAAHTSLGQNPILYFGTEVQKRRYLPRLARGEILGSYGLTEPAAGSDAGATATTAVREGDTYYLSGGKIFITSGSRADVLVVTAITDRGAGKKGISAFIMEKGTPGFTIGKAEEKLGLRSSDTSALLFDRAPVPADRRLGPEGEGFKMFLKILDGGRIGIGAMAVGLAQGAYDAVLEFVRTSGGVGLAVDQEQILKAGVADLSTRIEAARLLVYRAAAKKDAGEDYVVAGAQAKLFAAEVCTWAALAAADLVGWEALREGHPINLAIRDAKLCEIGEGTSQIQRMVIAREILKSLPA